MDKPPDRNPVKGLINGRSSSVGLKDKRVCIVAAAVIIVFVTLGLYLSDIGYSVYMGQTPIGVVRNRKMVEEIVARVTREIEEEFGDRELIIATGLKMERVRLSGEKPIDRDILEKRIKDNINLKRQAVMLYIDGQPVVRLDNRNDAENVLEDIKASFTKQKEGVTIDRAYFKEDIQLVEGPVDIEDLVEPETAYKYLMNGTIESKPYTVGKGDSLWLISKNNNISVEDIEKANPDINPKRLQIGQQLSLVVPKPFVTVVTEEEATYKEQIPFQTEYKESGEFFKGESVVRTYGKYGEREVTAKVMKENGMEVAREILNERVIKNPVTRMVAVGTKPPPPKQGTGTFSYPARGNITSRFGMRSGRSHNGIDIALPTGTPVKAADGGTVKFSGRYSSFGYLVIIDHGDGYETYYGHNSKNLVSKGDKVYKGQTIAMSGNTGRSTGPHLHFEVRRFGVPYDPLTYLNK